MSNQMKSLAALLALLVPVFVNAGCLVKETHNTLCLEPDGAVRWTILERNIHATGDIPADRQREEDEFMALVAGEGHKTAVAFRALGASELRTNVISAEWPFAVMTEARFPDIGRLWQQYFDTVGMHAKSVVTRAGDRTTWTLVVDVDQEGEGDGNESDVRQAVQSLLDDSAPIILFLRHGQFVEATGFSIDDDGRVAKLDDLDTRDWEKQPRLVLSLTWTATETVSGKQ